MKWSTEVSTASNNKTTTVLLDWLLEPEDIGVRYLALRCGERVEKAGEIRPLE